MKPYQCHNRPPFKTETVLQDHHGRILAARKLGMDDVPCIELAGLTDTQRRIKAMGLWPTNLSGENE